MQRVQVQSLARELGSHMPCGAARKRNSEFSKAAGYKNNVLKSIEFLYSRCKLSKIEIKRTIPFIRALKTKYLGINLVKDVKYLYTESYRTLLRKK